MKIFINNCRSIDFAYINREGQIIGGSYRPKIVIDSEKNVNVSSIQNLIDSFLVDDQQNGFDHKLWWINGFSNGQIQFNSDNTVHLETQHVKVVGPSNIIRTISSTNDVVSKFVYPGQVRYVMTEFLEKRLAERVGLGVSLMIELDNTSDRHPYIDTEYHNFRFVHGNKSGEYQIDQNIAHGHYSYLAASIKLHSNKMEADLLLRRIADQLDKKVFIWEDNVVRNDQHCAYLTYKCSRGNMSMEVSQDQAVIINTETTVEHLVDYIVERWYDDFKKVGISSIWCSEGLSKGAMVNLDD